MTGFFRRVFSASPLIGSFALMLILTGCIEFVQEDGYVYEPLSAQSSTNERDAVWRDRALSNKFIGHRFDPARQCFARSRTPLNQAPFDNPQLKATSSSFEGEVLSRGDLVEVMVHNGEMFEGSFVVNTNGQLRIPQLGRFKAAGVSTEFVARAIERRLVQEGFFPAHAAHAELLIRQLGEISANVSGSVFNPGLISVANRTTSRLDPLFDEASGSSNWRRQLSGILKGAGGIRPDADLSNVKLHREGKTVEFDMRGIMTGSPVSDPVVVDGDQVFVPSRQCFDPDLVRVSRITPPGIRVFISNPTRPNYSQGVEGGSFESKVPYGSRLLQGLVSANCIGGTRNHNANRYAILVGNNALSGEYEGIRVHVQDVIQNPNRPDLNPYLQSEDVIACYDSKFVNVNDIANTLGSIIGPSATLLGLLGI